MTTRIRRGLPVLALLPFLAGARAAEAQHLPDLVSTDALRVCSDPTNMPFSERAADGFENKIAEIIADELKVKPRYYWLTQGPGFARNTLGTGLCDVIIGTSGSEVVQATNPYYRSGYVLVTRGDDLASVRKLDDPRLLGKAIGTVAGTPPNDRLRDLGLIGKSRVYAAYTFSPSRSHQTVAAEIVADLAASKIDAAILWGPAAGWLARQSGVAMTVTPLLEEPERPPMTFRITMGVRHNENDWKRTLNSVLRKRAADIEKVLRDYDVPLLDDDGRHLLKAETP